MKIMEITFSLKVNLCLLFSREEFDMHDYSSLDNSSINTIILFFVCYRQGKYAVTQELTLCNTSSGENIHRLLVTFMHLICGMRLDSHVIRRLQRCNYLLKSTM